MTEDNIVINATDCVTVNTDGLFTASKLDFSTPVEYVKLREDAIEPTNGSAEAAGYDLYVPAHEADIEIPAHETVLINTQLSMKLPNFTFGGIFARSGLATKQGLRPANCVGVVDSDYRGPVCVALHNDTNEDKIVSAGERIAQLIVVPYIYISFKEVESLDQTERGAGSFGSTGK